MDALGAVLAASARFGLGVVEPVVLRDTNNLVVWLAPQPVVAKVGPAERLRLEREVMLELWHAGAPVVGPAAGLPEGVHSEGENAMSFWTYLPQPSDVAPATDQIATRLADLHRSLDAVGHEHRDQLGSFTAELYLARSILTDGNCATALPDADRALLSTHLARSLAELDRVPSTEVLHGSPHAYNVLMTGHDVCFIDFETVCLGPHEWDLAHLPEAVAATYPGSVDSELLAACRTAVSVKTAVFCWADAQRGDLRQHAEHHTALLRRSS